jgi:hypothetical protein
MNTVKCFIIDDQEPACQLIEEYISKIDSIFLEAKRKEDEENAKRKFSLPSYYEYPIEAVEVTSRNPFEWEITIRHKIPEIWEGCREDYYEHCVKKDDRLFVKLKIIIYNIKEKREDRPNDTYYIYLNRLSGHSHLYYDFTNILRNAL